MPVWTRRTNPCIAASNGIKHKAKTPADLDRMRIVVRIVCRGCAPAELGSGLIASKQRMRA